MIAGNIIQMDNYIENERKICDILKKVFLLQYVQLAGGLVG